MKSAFFDTVDLSVFNRWRFQPLFICKNHSLNLFLISTSEKI